MSTRSYGSTFDGNLIEYAKRLLNEIRAAKQSVTNLTNLINTEQDSQQVRDQLSNERATLLTKAQSLAKLNITDIGLSQEVMEEIGTLKSFISQSKQKQDNFPFRNKQVYAAVPGGDIRGYMQQQQQQQISLQNFTIKEISGYEVDNNIIKDSNVQMKDIAEGLKFVDEITTDLGGIINEQSSIIESVHSSSYKTSKIHEQGFKHINEAGKSATGARVKYCIIILVILGGLLAVLAIIGARVGIYAAAA